MKISNSTNVQMPLKTVVSLITLVAVGTWAYFGIVEKLNKHSSTLALMEKDLIAANEFITGVPKGDMVSPQINELFMLVEFITGLVEDLQRQMEDMKFNQVNIKRLQEDMIEARENIEKLKNKIRENGSH